MLTILIGLDREERVGLLSRIKSYLNLQDVNFVNDLEELDLERTSLRPLPYFTQLGDNDQKKIPVGSHLIYLQKKSILSSHSNNNIYLRYKTHPNLTVLTLREGNYDELQGEREYFQNGQWFKKKINDELLPDYCKNMDIFKERSSGIQAGGVTFKVGISSYSELLIGHFWKLENPTERRFLPFCVDDEKDFSWYHLLNEMDPNMSSVSDSTHPLKKDRPIILERLEHQGCSESFAAVLGDPVDHSHTPTEHQNYFKKLNTAVFAIPIKREEWSEAIEVLRKIGLKYAAVTSPLKELAYKYSDKTSSEAKEYQSVNTLYLEEKEVIGHNTDKLGLETAISKFDLPSEVAIWGGGGTLKMLKSIFTKALCFSARTGLERTESGRDPSSIKTLIWACGNSLEYQFPPTSWNLETIMDLSYMKNSMGRSFALDRGLRYLDGHSFFREQAKLQRSFWNECAQN